MDKILVMDFGGQYAHLIANRIRRLNVYSEIVHNDISIDELQKPEIKGIILSGGPTSVFDDNAPKPDKKLFQLDKPILGLCYGQQLMAHELNGKVESGKKREYGSARIDIKNKNDLFQGLNDSETVWMSHGDNVEEIPKGFEILASTADCPVAGMGNGKYFGLQFHPEVTHTPNGMKILENFVNICKAKKEWTMKNFANEKIEEIKKQANEKNVFLLVSGGVDSTVGFVLLNKALGAERVHGLHIDNGFMRKDESILVKESLAHYPNLHIYDASDEFLDSVKDVYDPEEKRKIIGKKFVEVAHEQLKNLKLDPNKWILGQGTIYPDTIESAGTKHAALIKTHHNRVEEIQKLIEEGKVIEPINQLYKDEVRALGRELGIKDELIDRHPFPGPGLAVRCLCAEKEDEVENKEELEKGISKIIKENLSFVILPLKSVGVQGDNRTYAHPCVIVGDAKWDELEEISTNITNKFKDINRVIKLIRLKGGIKRDNIKIKKAYLTEDRLDLLREADSIVNKIINEKNLLNKIWQFPVVLIPLQLSDGESIVLRPVYSQEAMTAKFADIDIKIVEEMADKILELDGIDAVFYDITHKPPGTIEWE
ncbi:glutamine-hydrolyzing GMP synthase [Nanoarchaeota archaeon]